ncbi:LVIS_2131 family protein [Lacticaseibacillus thailandensis]|uniref:Uncharacterized protein n=1 Tax=Lacticaseibacillus thailandensis DSM 22698 = JCM 13996 TaxID=1423810 RepID=A0A0R2CF76_9LACO|nr:LVIS_2131 family protein [Lacticaseibacillus thailandensis]KRM87081.1 hypothetical protein FD19_GL001232 [Lacticaseibacillus thailandensis DSM 22698 = JCM 13996]
MNAWNFIGVAAWIILVVYLIFIVINIRQRHLKMIVVHGQHHSGRTILIDLVEVVVFLAALYGLVYAAWLRPTNFTNSAEATVSYKYQPLVLQTDDKHSYYVEVRSGSGKNSLMHYTYWVENAKVEVNSNDATVSDGSGILNLQASHFPWHAKKLASMDRQTDKAFVATITARYKGNFLNGLGLRAGKTGDRFSLIRVPSDDFSTIVPLNDGE